MSKDTFEAELLADASAPDSGQNDLEDGGGQETVSTVTGTTSTVGEEPASPATEIPWMWVGLGAALLIAVIAAAAARYRNRRRRREIQPTVLADARAGGDVLVGKLHEQGAREYQQDSFSVSPEEQYSQRGLLAVVADGMGGLSNGDKVSQTAVTTMMNGFYQAQGDPDLILLALLEQANQEVNRLLGPEERGKSGSTLVAGLLKGGRFHYLSVGDSRVSLYRDGVLQQLNREHIYSNELAVRVVNREISYQDAVADPSAKGLTSYLGMGALKYVDLPAQPVTVRPGDKFILMCDGVYNALTDEELTGMLSAGASQAAEAIRAAIRDKNYPTQDNYTAVILECR